MHVWYVVRHFSRVRLSATPWTAACQAPLSMGFSRQEYWSGLPFPPLGDLQTQGLNPSLPRLLHFRRILYPGASGIIYSFSDSFPIQIITGY